MEEEETSIEYIQDNNEMVDEIIQDNHNFPMIDGIENIDSVAQTTNKDSAIHHTRKKARWIKLKENIPLVLSNEDIRVPTDCEHLNLNAVQEIIEKECKTKDLVNGKEPWSLWLSRVADWICLGSTVIIICILLSVLIFYLYKDREVL